jgi:C-terminal peptidase prc
MRLTRFSRIGCVLLLVAYGLSATRCLYADEAPVTASNLKEDAFGSAADQGRLAWAILEAIEQQNISPPSRQAMIQVITRTLFRIPKEAEKPFPYRELLERVDSEFLQCQSADEMALVVEGNKQLHLDFDRVIAELTSGFGENLGGFRLIRAKDHDVKEQIQGNRYVGLGVRLRMNDSSRLPIFAAIIPGGPADRAGLKPNTTIYEVDGRPTEKVPLETIVDWIRGPVGSDVTLRVSSDGTSEQRLVTLRRGLVRVESLRNQKQQLLTKDGLRFDPREPIGWISVGDINSSTLHELRVAEQYAKEDGIRVLVLDFRGFGRDGDLHQSLLIADSFLDGGAIWTRIDGSAEPRIEFADRECLFRDIPLVVLIDRTTQPCHCAIAAALQDAGRAKIVGESPEFNGIISSTVRLNGVPYSLTMATTGLKRVRQDRQWPVQPDYSVTENAKVTSPIRAVPTPRKNEEIMARPAAPKKRLPIGDVAILVALELQRALPAPSAQPADHVQTLKLK